MLPVPPEKPKVKLEAPLALMVSGVAVKLLICGWAITSTVLVAVALTPAAFVTVHVSVVVPTAVAEKPAEARETLVVSAPPLMVQL